MGALVTACEELLASDPNAVFCATMNRAFTRGEILELSAALESRVRAAAREGEVVGLALGNGPLLAAALLATLRSGRVALLLDATLPESTRGSVAAQLFARALLTADGRDSAAASTVDVATTSVAGQPELPRGTAILKLSSGSTRSPRGIALGEVEALHDAKTLAGAMQVGPGDRALTVVPMSFSYGFSSLLVPALCYGLELVLPLDDGPFAALRAAHGRQATFFPAVPALIGGLNKLQHLDLPSSLRLTISAGAALSPASAAAFSKRFGRAIHAFYGASECGGICYDATGDAALRGTVGTPLPGVSVQVGGNDGTVVVRSPGVALGYWPTPDQNLQERTFSASDCACFEGGELRLLGRKNDSINVDGRKVHPQEVEAVLGAMPGVDDVAVVKDEASSREGEACWALIACEAGAITRTQVVAWCRERLPYYMVPRRITVLSQLPRNPRGKLDRETLTRLTGGGDA